MQFSKNFYPIKGGVPVFRSNFAASEQNKCSFLFVFPPPPFRMRKGEKTVN